MTPATYIAIAFLLAVLAAGGLLSLLMDTRAELRAERARRIEVVKSWRAALERNRELAERIAQGSNETPGFVGERPHLTLEEHIADALDVVQFGPVEAARRGVRLPGAEVVEFPRRDGGA